MNVTLTVHVTVEMHFNVVERKLRHKQRVTKLTPVTRVFLSFCLTQRRDSASILMELKDFFHDFIFLKLPHDRVKVSHI